MAATAPLCLLRAALAHEYFSGDFTEFALKPLPATATGCRRLGLRLLRDGATLSLFADADAAKQASTPAYRMALGRAALCWELVPTDPEFSAFTGIDFNGSTETLILTSDDTGATGGLLTQSGVASADDLWSRQGLSFDLRPTRPLEIGSNVLLQTAGGLPLRGFAVSDPSLVSIDAAPFGSGLYRATRDKSVLASWFADERVPARPTPGAVLVLPGELLTAALARALGPGAEDAPDYSATFPARKVIWRYHIFNAGEDERLAIVTAPSQTASPGARGRAAAFVPVVDPSLPTARSFEAVRPFKLAQEAPQRFALNSGAATRYSPLPLAGFSFARSARGAALCSDIFVYL